MPIPEGWEDASQIILLGPEADGFRRNLVFSQEPTRPNETAEEFAARQLPQLQQGLEQYMLLNEGPVVYEKNAGYLREHIFSTGREAIGQLQFYIVRNDRAYTFTYTQLSDGLAADRPIAENFFRSATLHLPDERTHTDDV